MGKLHERREKCYASRDDYWRCVDNPQNYGKPRENHPCAPHEKAFNDACPESWVKYFTQMKDRENLVATQASIGEIRREI